MSENMSSVRFDKILVVDDTTANLQLLTNLLLEHGYTVYPASDGKLALRFVRSTQPDIILLDIRMPGIDGYEVCRRLKADERTRSIPIIFISILEDEGEKVKGFQAGAVDYITKPFQPEEVLARVETHLRMRALTEDLEHTVAERTAALHAVNAQLQRELAERKQAEEVLHASETRYRIVADNTYDWEFWLNPQGQFLYSSPSCERITGYTPADFETDPTLWHRIIHPDDLSQYERHQQEVLRSHSESKQEFRIVRPDGTQCWLGHVCGPVYDDTGQFLGVRGSNRDITERKQAEESLKRERLLLANIMETSPIGITTVDANGQITFANTQAVNILGLTKDEITQRTYNAPDWRITDFAGDPFPDEHLPFRQVMITRQPVYDVQHAIVWPGGRRMFLSINGAPILDESGRVERVVFAIQDITERKRAEEDLRQRETLLNATQRLAKIGGWDWDVERQTSFWTEETYRIHGLAPQASAPGSTEYIDRSLACYDPADRPVVSAAFERCLQQGDGYDLEFSFTSADGCRKWIRTTATAVREQGRIVKAVGSIMDITERKRAEEALRQSEEKYRTLFEHVNEGFALHEIIVDDRGVPIDYRFLEINPAFEAMTGLERTKVIGKTVREILPGIEHDPADWIGRYGHVALTGEGITFENYSEPLGRWYQVNAFSPGTGYFAVTFTDITERKAAEDALHRLNTELDQRVLERTAQLEAANTELADFSYSVSHDLRAPLRHIDGFLDLLHQGIAGSLDARSQHYMDTIASAARRMGTLIDSLLAFYQMRRKALFKEHIDLNDLVREVIRELEPEALDRNIHWQVADLPDVIGDRAMLQIVFVNLIANAVKFTRSRNQAEIEIGCLSGNNAEVIIFVRDNGVGFDMQYVDKLFGVFQRLHHVDEFEGTGIGLANVRRIISRHGGRTWAEGTVNQGATLYFALPQKFQGAS